MRNSLRLSVGAVALATLAACSRSSEQPALTDDMKQDLARAGAADVQLAGSSAPRVDVVSALERNERAVPAPRAPLVTKAPSASRGQRAVVKSVRHEAPAAAPAPRAAEEVAPSEVVREEPAPEPVPAQARPRAPLPSTQREPPGGWRSPGSIIRNAPFPINP